MIVVAGVSVSDGQMMKTSMLTMCFMSKILHGYDDSSLEVLHIIQKYIMPIFYKGILHDQMCNYHCLTLCVLVIQYSVVEDLNMSLQHAVCM